MNLLREFFAEEEGMGTVEILLIIAVLVCVALIFRKAIVDFVKNIIDTTFDGGEDMVDKTLQEAEEYERKSGK